MTDARDYVGDLLVEAYGFDPSGEPILRLSIAAEVVPIAELEDVHEDAAQ